jgi:Tfp pilus tip-associated adhesin PilY1
MKKTSFRQLVRSLCCAAALSLSPLLAAQTTFDPVHEDTDIFLVNPSITSERPNVLILLDNTANWNSPFTNEKAALVSVVNGLNEFFNVGLAMFVETGSPNDNVDGAYVRFGVRQMTSTNKAALSTMVNALDIGGDKGNNATPALAMGEVYNYFAGRTSYSGWGKAKSDYAGNTTYNPLAASLPGNAFAQVPAAATATSKIYTSPVADNCQKNFVIYISNGTVNENSSALATAKTQLEAAKGSTATTLPISPSGQQGNWADEWAAFMANSGFNVTIDGTPQNVKVTTYTIEVDPGTTGQGPDTTALMKSIASQGKGKYFSTSSGSTASSLVDALNQIFNEIQSVNSVFASTTLPVSVNVRGTNLNQVYIGMFRPDPAKAPRWYGNLKLYKLALDTSDNLILTDSLGNAAEDPNTGFVRNTSTSHWTHSSTFWNFRSSDENGPGGGSDAPDGDLVEKGAVAQRLRDAYATSQTTRKLYTCIGDDCVPCTIGGSGSAKTCSNSVDLSAMPFDADNDDIDAISLGLGIKAVASLSAKVTKTVNILTDRREVAISNAGAGSVAISSLNNGAITRAVGTLNTTRGPFPITTLTAAATLTFTISNITNATTGSGSSKTNTFTLTTASAHGLAVGDSFTISGNTASGGSNINNTYTVSQFISTTSFKFVGANGNIKWGTNGSISYLGTSTTARATLTAHGFTNLQDVTITGAANSVFNKTTPITVIDANTFTYSLTSAQGATTGGSVSGDSKTALVTTSAAHGFTAGNSIVIAGANPAGYNGTFSIATVPSANSFTYSVAAVTPSPPFLTPNTNSGVTATKGGSTQVDVTTGAAHGLIAGATVTISGADSCYNGSYTVLASPAPTATTFSYTRGVVCPQNFSATAVVSTGYSTIVTATLANHGYVAGDSVLVDDGSEALHNGTFSVLAAPAPTATTFAYTNNAAFLGNAAPSGTYTVRLASNPLAYAASTTHGFADGSSVTIAGATPIDYNGAKTISVVDANTFSYPLTAALGAASGTITAAQNTTTAVANVVNHGFADGSSVIVSGATPNDFNGTKTIDLIDANNFSYTIGSAQGNATGTIVAAQGSGSDTERDAIINWVRGQDNQEDENLDGIDTDCRASVHSDVLHSRPAVINYNRYDGDNDVYVFYGGNDGIFRSVKGGPDNDPSDPTTLNPGDEAWGFIPEEGYTSLQRLRNNSPKISSSFKKPYFMDGPIGVHTIDGNGDGKIDASVPDDGDLTYLYIGTRRGGRYAYSLDVSDPVDPKYRWKIDNTSTGFNELGYTWSQPTVVTNITGYSNPVLIFGGGYDPAVEDIENCTIITSTSSSVTYYSGAITYETNATGCTKSDGSPIIATSTPTVTVDRTMGRALYVVDAITGALIWWAGPVGSGATLEVDDMDYAIPSDVIVVRNLSGGNTNRAYVGDTGGNVWRFDFGTADKANWTVTRIAAVADLTTKAGRRKFLFPPDVVEQDGFDALLIGSGDREHPFDYSVTNRFYMLKDKGNDSGAITGTDPDDHPTLTESLLFDATDNCLQECTGTDLIDAQTDFFAAEGWYITLGVGEKNIGNAVALNGVVFFNTNQPSTASSNCESNLGIARQYKVALADATAPSDTNADSVLTAEDRSTVHAGGGYLPSPVHVVVQVLDAEGNLQTVEGVISGTSVEQPPGTSLNARTRAFWYKEID